MGVDNCRGGAEALPWATIQMPWVLQALLWVYLQLHILMGETVIGRSNTPYNPMGSAQWFPETGYL